MRKKITFLLFALLLSFCFFPVRADSSDHVIDEHGILSQEQKENLEQYAKKIEKNQKISVYIRVYQDMKGYSTIEAFSEKIYTSQNLGSGQEREGIMLLLTMRDRGFDIVAHGKKSKAIYHAKKREEIASKVVNNYLRQNNYYEGFRCFMKECVNTVMVPFYIRCAISGIVPLLIAALYVFALKRRHHSADIQLEAMDYIQRGLQLSKQSDIYLYTTTTVIHKPKNDSSDDGGGFHSSSSGSFGHTSGHF